MTGAANGAHLVDVRQGAGYEVWTMRAEPVNAIGSDLLSEFRCHLHRAGEDPEMSAIVLTSGLKVFSAGADATWIAGVIRDRGVNALVEEFIATMDGFRALCWEMRRSDLLFVAAVNGHALAGGLELAAACDLRFVADDDRLRIGVPEMDLFGALPSGGGGVQYLTRLMHPSHALDFILEAKPVSPRRAQQLGLADRLYPSDELDERAETFAREIAVKASRVGVAAAKRAILGGAELHLYAALEMDRAIHWDALRRGNFVDRVEAFVDRFASSDRSD